MKRGFTLLELLISCLLLVSILAILAVVIARANTLRGESVRRTTLLTQGRAVLDILAEDLQSVIGTNLEVAADTDPNDFGVTNTVLWLVRATPPPRGTEPGSATNPPVEGVLYEVIPTNIASDITTYYLARSHAPLAAAPESGIVDTNLGYVVTRRWEQNGSPYEVTNVISGTGTTLLPSGRKGETIMFPVNREGSIQVYDWISTGSTRLEVTPTADTNINRVVATVVVSNSFSRLCLYANSQTNAPHGLWPAVPQNTIITGYQAVTFVNPWTGSSEIAAFSNSPPETAVAYTNDPLRLVEFTNDWRTVQWQDGGAPSFTTTLLQVVVGYTNYPAAVVSNAWTLPPDTNSVGGVRGASEWFDWSSFLTTTASVLTNVEWIVSSVTNSYDFATNLPLSFSSISIFDAGVGPAQFVAQESLGAVALSHGATQSPIQTQLYWRATETVATNRATNAGLSVTVWQRVSQVSAHIVETFVPASFLSPGYYPGDDRTTYWDPVDTRSNDTIWTPHTLEEDYEGGEVEIDSLWLKKGERAPSQFVYITNSLPGLAGTQGANEGEISEPEDEVIDGLAAFNVQPLCFARDGESEPWELTPWPPEESSPRQFTPPVCVDIYLELLDPPVARRAATMKDDAARRAFVARNVVRLSRRVSLRGRNRWGEP